MIIQTFFGPKHRSKSEIPDLDSESDSDTFVQHYKEEELE